MRLVRALPFTMQEEHLALQLGVLRGQSLVIKCLMLESRSHIFMKSSANILLTNLARIGC